MPQMQLGAMQGVLQDVELEVPQMQLGPMQETRVSAHRSQILAVAIAVDGVLDLASGSV